jgi:NAD(P)-dependent dehydrogenase (short-subunit alcohol dehydrogenase family)
MATRSVLITGASTGIGRACALWLDRAGWRVFAGIRNPTDADSLASAASPHLTPVSIDVTDERSIEATAEKLGEEVADNGLQGLVNNAGISVQGPLEYLEPEEIQRQFAVNVTGHVAVTQAMLPLLRLGRGRIVMMSSIAGRSISVPLISPYTASKVALEAIGEALRYELMPEGIHVVLIEPGSIATPIWSKGIATIEPAMESLPPEGRRRYSRMIEAGRRLGAQQDRMGRPPDRVAAKVEHALTTSRPHLRYLVGWDANLRARVEPFVPRPIKDVVVRRLFGFRKGPE